MSTIKKLDSSLYNLISAGEVVERPSSVVKELVENSLDAGAKNIKIEIECGGKNKIKVSDDGCGISARELYTAFLPHATSKITCKDDLFNITTLGFRGEALASIAAVSMVTAVSKTSEDECAHGIELKGGELISEFEFAGVEGTSICVENLFFATPARLKFLKKDKSEELEISSLVSHFILANPTVSFTYVIDGKLIYKTQSDNLKNAISNMYKRDITMNLFEIKNTLNNYSLYGFISVPSYFKGNRSYQTIILNGRIITNKTIIAAIEKAYEPFLMKRSFPLFVLNINLPNDCFDVNVHPSKFDVRFEDNNSIFSFIYHSLSKALMQYDDVKQIPQLEYVDESNYLINDNGKNSVTNDNENIKLDDNVFDNNLNYIKKNSFTAKDNCDTFYRAIKNKMASIDSGDRTETYLQNDIFNNVNIAETCFDFEGKIIGQIFETYILVEKDDNLYIIDQHAAHEKMLYDKLTKSTELYSQPLLIPYIYNANSTEYERISDYLSDLSSIGFDICEFSPMTFKVNAVPEVLIDIDFEQFFAYITKDFFKTTIKTNDFIKEKLMQSACKSAIKAGDKLNDKQINYLIKTFAESENKPLQCPHGRPAVVKISKTDLEKWFKRKL